MERGIINIIVALWPTLLASIIYVSCEKQEWLKRLKKKTSGLWVFIAFFAWIFLLGSLVMIFRKYNNLYLIAALADGIFAFLTGLTMPEHLEKN